MIGLVAMNLESKGFDGFMFGCWMTAMDEFILHTC